MSSVFPQQASPELHLSRLSVDVTKSPHPQAEQTMLARHCYWKTIPGSLACSCGQALEGCEDQPEDFSVSFCKHRSYIHEKIFVVVVGISRFRFGLYQSLHWAAVLRVEDWVEEKHGEGLRSWSQWGREGLSCGYA